jgi:predicted ArsR family transcriptional regulator
MIFGLVWLSAIVWGPEDTGKLSGDDVKALLILASGFRDQRAGEIASAMSVTPQKALFHIDRLKELGYAHRSVLDLAGNHAYAITAEGRAALVKRKLL